MNQKLQQIFNIIQQSDKLDADQKDALLKGVKDADKELEITAFKLDRTEKVKRTTAILLEETIEELEQKRKAVEEQNRVLEIEASLERVRSRTMGMQKSDELPEVAKVIFDQIMLLGGDLFAVGIVLCDKHEQLVEQWHSLGGEGRVTPFEVPIDLDYIHRYRYDQWKAGVELFSIEIPADYIVRHFELMFELPSVMKVKNDLALKGIDISPPPWEIDYGASFKYGYLLVSSLKPFNEEKIFPRFAKVFEQAYTRFLDLQKAEAQARESQIEAALERVRSRTMGMHKSEEVGDVSDILFSEFNKLNLKVNGSSIVVIDEDEDKMELWRARSSVALKPFESTSLKGAMELLKKNMPDWHPKFVKALSERKNYIDDEFSGERRLQFINAMVEQFNYALEEKSSLLKNTPQKIVTHFIFFKLGYLALLGEKQLSEEEITIARRFVEVFEFSYTRFLDIIRAEAQAREAEIQLALERVRARTMAMQKSNELAQASANIFSQLNELGINPYRCNIAIVDAKEVNCQVWSTTNSGNVIPTSSALPLNEFPLLVEMFDGWKSQRDNHKIKLFGNDRLEWTKYISKYVPFDEYKKENLDENEILNTTAYFYNFYFKQGFFTIHSKEEIADNHLQVIQRFANVFEQTFTRFLDLVNAEKQNRIIQEENKRKTEELEEARQLQLAMLPKDIPQLPNLEIAVYMKTATEVGGDYYDFHVSDGGTLSVVLGDATGHGMKAGTMVTITKSLFNTLASSKDIIKTFRRISRVIKDMKFRQLSMCLQMVKIRNNKLTVSSAAMPPLFIYNKNIDSVEEILLSGMPLGSMIDFKYKMEERKLNSGDVLLMLSDGMPELANNHGNMYGYERIKNDLKANAEKKPGEIIEYLNSAAEKWLDGIDADDDITFVVIKVK